MLLLEQSAMMSTLIATVGIFLGITLLLVIILLVAKKYLVKSGDVNININDTDNVKVPAGKSLLSTLADQNIFLSSACGGKGSGEPLLTPTKIYVKPVLALLEKIKVKGISHITGGGFYENIPRSIPDSLGAKIDRSAVKVLPIFDLIAKAGNICERDMFNTFNMGVGMSIVVSKDDADEALSILKASGEEPYIIGEIVSSAEKIEIC